MTILPKKKAAKEKTEAEGGELSQLPHSPSSHTHSHSESRASRRTSSPTRWGGHKGSSHASRDDRRTYHDPGGSYEEYGAHENGPSHSKRRHRSSPHRHIRKHRHDRGHISSGSHTHSNANSESNLVSLDLDLEEVNSGYNSEDEYSPPTHPENIEELEHWFEAAVREKKGLVIKKMAEDGACLFRAVADQVFGDQEMHSIVRKSCVDYMAKNTDFFKQYVTEDFQTYLNRKRTEHCHGNHIEMQAMCELYNRPIEVYQYSLEPINTFHGAYKTDNEPIRVSYHRNMHYNSVVDPCKATIGVGLGLPGFQPGLAEKNQMQEAMRHSEDFHIEKTMLEDKMKETDWEVTQETIEEQVARESYLQWLRDNEKRAKRQASPRSASATCSSATESHTWCENTAADSSRSPDTQKVRSPRNRNPESGQNSPNHPYQVGHTAPSSNPVEATTSVPGCTACLSPQNPRPGCSGTRSPSPHGAVGGVNLQFKETTSIMNTLPPTIFGLSDWDEDDVLAQVMAQSQQEYLDKLKKQAVCSHKVCRTDHS